jgi:hypothetical protein
MTSKAKDYWAYARECELWASSSADERDRAIFLEMQQAWTELALQKQSALRGVGQSIENARPRMEGSAAAPSRKRMMALRVLGIFLAGVSTGTFLVSSSGRWIGETTIARAEMTLSSFVSPPAKAAR